MRRGFTLIELSIVLVIIGLIVSGILVGKDMITNAETRRQISQIESLKTAVGAFKVKYDCLPGDCADAESKGFPARGPYPGEGDGNGLIDTRGAHNPDPAYKFGQGQAMGETVVFWVDLSMAGLISQAFNTAASAAPPGIDITTSSTPAIRHFLPSASLKGLSIYVYSDHYVAGPIWVTRSTNHFGISEATLIAASSNYGQLYSNPIIPVHIAYNIDSKMDDGLPQSGVVLARYLNAVQLPWNDIPYANGYAGTGAAAASSTTCFDNGNTAGEVQRYSMSVNGGNGANCALSFKF